MMKSIWERETTIPKRRPLEQDISVDVAVIGAGMAGILTAYFLQEAGLSVAVLEAKLVGSGQTRHTTAKITAQHGLIYGKLLEKFGKESAQQYAQANTRAIDEFWRIIKENNIDCQMEKISAYLYSTMDNEPLKQEMEAARIAGIEAEMADETGLPFAIKGALQFPRQAQFQPFDFLSAISSKLTVYEQTMANGIEDSRILTDGGTVSAKDIVIATHYPFLNTPGYYFMRMHQERSYVLALENTPELDGMYYSIDPGGFSMRNAQDLLLLGGGNHRTGENPTGGRYDTLRSAAEQLFPGSREVTRWSAQDCVTLDAIPYIGQYSESTPHLYVATGFHKWGMTSSMVSAMILSGMITKRETEFAPVFDPHRFVFSASAKTLMEEGAHAVKGLSRQVFSIPDGEIKSLPPGHGGIVETDGGKAGVYKDEDGEVHIVSAKCPHLGCELSWNPDEKSWDCPCHGSRFDYHGRLIDNPAMEGIGNA